MNSRDFILALCDSTLFIDQKLTRIETTPENFLNYYGDLLKDAPLYRHNSYFILSDGSKVTWSLENIDANITEIAFTHGSNKYETSYDLDWGSDLTWSREINRIKHVVRPVGEFTYITVRRAPEFKELLSKVVGAKTANPGDNSKESTWISKFTSAADLIDRIANEPETVELTLDNGKVIQIWNDENNGSEDGTEVGRIISYDGTFYRIYGYYSSWDDVRFQEEFYEVTRKFELVNRSKVVWLDSYDMEDDYYTELFN